MLTLFKRYIYIYIYISWNHHQGVFTARIPLTQSLLPSFLSTIAFGKFSDSIHCLHKADGCDCLLVGQHLYVYVLESIIRVYHKVNFAKQKFIPQELWKISFSCMKVGWLVLRHVKRYWTIILIPKSLTFLSFVFCKQFQVTNIFLNNYSHITNNLLTVIWFQVFSSNMNNFQTDMFDP